MDIDQLEQMITLYEQGHSTHEVGARFGCSGSTVLKHFQRAGVQLRPRGVRPGHGRPTMRLLTEAQDAEAARLYRNGAIIDEVAQALGVSHKAARNALLRQGVPLRSKKVAQLHMATTRDARLGPRIKGRHVNSDGYAVLTLSQNHPLYGMTGRGGRVLEHRFVMANSLGRPLTAAETVHHKNGVRDDNRLENLQLRQGQHGNGRHLMCADCGSSNIVPADLTTVA